MYYAIVHLCYKVVIKIATNRTEINKRWQDNNKEHTRYLNERSRTRSFIRNKATKEDIEEIKKIIVEREEKLK